MIAISRWNEYSVNATTGYTSALVGTPGYVKATNQSGTDAFTITGSTDNLRISIEGEEHTLVLASGTDLDPRFVALDIQRKLQDSSSLWSAPYDDYALNAKCEWEEGHFAIYLPPIGNGITVDVVPTAGEARTVLGFDATSKTDTTTATNGYGGVVTISGTYHGQFDDIYTIIASKNSNYGSVTKTSGDYDGTVTIGGTYKSNTTRTYTITIDTTNGVTMGAGAGLVPQMSWSNNDNTDNGGPIDLLYPDTWYAYGINGNRIKFTDSAFDTAVFQFTANGISQTHGSSPSGPVGTAYFIVRSLRGDDAAPALTSLTPVDLGSQGLTVSWTSDTIQARDYWVVYARSIAPTSDDAGITTANFGNVTVSTDSPVKVVQFEIMSGAVIMDSLKFGLNNDGGFQHHQAGDNDTFVHFGTVGAGNPNDAGHQWETGITAVNLSEVTRKTGPDAGPPEELYSSVKDLTVVNSADDSEAVGNTGLVSDFIFLGIKLGASETSANTITYRIFYDFS